MRFRALADAHFEEWPQFSHRTEDGWNSRLVSQLSAATKLCVEGSKKPKIAVFLGDLVHRRGPASQQVQYAMKEFISKLAEQYDQVFLIPGNHDYPMRSGASDINSMSAIVHALKTGSNSFDHVRLINKPELVTVPGGQFAFVPWMPDVDAIHAAAAKLSEDAGPCCVLVCHVAMKGGDLGTGVSSEHGADALSLLGQKYRMVLAGDFHKAQMVAARGDRQVWYNGAMHQHTRGDEGQTRGAVDWEVISNRAPDRQVVTIEQPEFFSVLASTQEDLDDAEFLRSNGHYVTLHRAATCPKSFGDLSSSGFAVLDIPKPIDSKETRLNVSPTSSVPQVFDAYLSQANIYRLTHPPHFAEELRRKFEVVSRVVAERPDLTTTPFVKVVGVSADNFLGYSSLQVNLDARGVVLIEGENLDDPEAQSNGAGKSCVAEAIVYGWTGDTIKDVAVADLRNRFGETAGMRVELRLQVGESFVTITRSRGVKGTQDGVSLTVNGKREDLPTPAQTQARIEEITGFNKSLLLQTGFFGQGIDLALASGTDKDKKDLLEAFCGGSRFAPYHKAASEDLRNLETTRLDAQSEIRRGEESLRFLVSEEETFKQRAADFEKIQQADLAKLEAEGESIERSIQTATEAIETANAKHRKLAATFGPEPTAPAVGEPNKALGEARERRAIAQATVSRLQQVIANTQIEACPECGRPFDAAHRAKALSHQKAQLAEAEIELNQASEALAGLILAENEATRSRTDQQAKHSLAVREWHQTKSTLETLTHTVTMVQHDIEGYKARQVQILDEADQVLARENGFDALAAEKSRQVKSAENTVAAAKSKVTALDAEIPVAKELVRLMGTQGLKAFLFDSLSPAITEGANKALEVLTAGTTQIRLSTKESASGLKVELIVENSLGAPSYEGNSGGQKRKVDLALAWALHGLIEDRLSFLFVDEAFDALDGAAGAAVVRLLTEKPRGTILVATHKPEFKEFFPERWIARRQGKNSTLIQE